MDHFTGDKMEGLDARIHCVVEYFIHLWLMNFMLK